MCADTRRPEQDYLAWLRPARPDDSDAYGAFGRRIFFPMQLQRSLVISTDSPDHGNPEGAI